MLLAAYLAATAGYVNSGGFVMIGSFTSHVTGSVGRFASDLANGHIPAALSALSLVAAFFVGAVVASSLLEATSVRFPVRYCLVLSLEATLLLAFVFVAGLSRTTHPRLLDGMAAILCAAMGLQNALVTRLSGAVIRTTHLTGIVTDLAIECVHWYRWYHSRLKGKVDHTAPAASRIGLLGTITSAFVVGAALGALLTAHASQWAMCLPAALAAFGAAFAFYQGMPRGNAVTS